MLVAMGFLAVWEAIQVFPYGGDPFFDDIQQINDEIGEGSTSTTGSSPRTPRATSTC